ncbi:hypothetical protein SB773_30130, partial [Bacillus sp. SIMBA_074]
QASHVIVPVTSFADEEIRTLAERAEAIGEQTLARHLYYLAGETVCPSCHEKISVWPSLLSTFTM